MVFPHYTPYSTPWTFSAAESHKLNRKLHIKLIRKDKKWKHYGPVVSFQKVPKIHFVQFWCMKVLPKIFFWDRNWTFNAEWGINMSQQSKKFTEEEEANKTKNFFFVPLTSRPRNCLYNKCSAFSLVKLAFSVIKSGVQQRLLSHASVAL